jgi:hypothetical protein
MSWNTIFDRISFSLFHLQEENENRTWNYLMNLFFRRSLEHISIETHRNTSNLIHVIHCSDKKRCVRECIVRYDVYSNSSFSKYIVSLMCTFFYIRVHDAKLDRTEQNEQYVTRQSIMISNNWYISFGTLLMFTSRITD